MTSRTPLMAGNWKMNLDHLQATHLVQKLDWSLKDGKHNFADVEVVVLPPFTDLRSVQTLVQGDQLDLSYGAQDLSMHDEGAYTGEISGAFLKKLGCSYVVVGHSECREHRNDTDSVVNARLQASLRHNLTPILCIGEPLDIRQAGTHVDYVLSQVKAGLEGLDATAIASAVLAYEPVWAIGTGEVATAADAQEVCAAIRGLIADIAGQEIADGMRILYGGSVKANNVASIMAQADVDGALVGGASINVDEFSAICRYQQQA